MKTSVALCNIVFQPVRTVGCFGGVYWEWGWEVMGGDKDIRGNVCKFSLFPIPPFLIPSVC